MISYWLRICNASNLRYTYNKYDPNFSFNSTTKVYYVQDPFKRNKNLQMMRLLSHIEYYKKKKKNDFHDSFTQMLIYFELYNNY